MIFFFKQKTAYEMRISDWSSDVCSSDLKAREGPLAHDAAEAIKRLTAEAEQIAMRLKETEAVRPDLDDRLARADIISRDAELDLARAMKKKARDRKSVVQGKRGLHRVDLGWRRTIKQNTKKTARNI